jgi:S1-C subfamily serine protease
MLLVLNTAQARIYKWEDADGNIQYTQTPPPKGARASSKEVRVRGAGGDSSFRLPEEIRDRYCAVVRKAGVGIAQKMRAGASANRLLTSSHATDSRLLVKQVVGFVYGFRTSKTTPDQIGNLLESQCHNGTYDGYAKAYLKKNYPEALPEGGAGAHSGTAWPIGRRWAITNNHVIGKHEDITLVLTDGRRLKAKLLERDAKNDLALLGVDRSAKLPPALHLAAGETGAGSDVFTIGYPHINVIGRSPKVTKGIVSSTLGIRDEQRFYQISVPVQSGNSGGPLFDMSGRVVGVVTAKLNAMAVLRRSGDLPQNVNYAIKSDVLAKFLERINVSARRVRKTEPTALSTLTADLKDSVMLVVAK